MRQWIVVLNMVFRCLEFLETLQLMALDIIRVIVFIFSRSGNTLLGPHHGQGSNPILIDRAEDADNQPCLYVICRAIFYPAAMISI